MRRGGTLLVIVLSITALHGAQGDSPARVEVVSIKAVNQPDDLRRLACGLPLVERTGSRIYIPFSQVCGLIRIAYNVAEYQVAGVPVNGGVGPANFFEVDVRLQRGEVPTLDETQQITRALLAERFKLRVRRETREQSIFALVPTNDGPKVIACVDPKAPSGYTPGRIISCNPPIPMPRILQFLSAETGRPVVDRTGLVAPTFELRWQPAQAEPQPDSPPGLFTAIQEQLALRLEAQRGPVEIITIDSVESPTAN